MKFTLNMGESFGKSLGGMSAGQTANGRYIRARATPKLPRTTKQSRTRQKFGSTSTFWHSVLPADRGAFLSAPENDGNFIAGFMQVNRIRNAFDQPIVLEAPTFVSPPAFTYASEVLDVGVPEPELNITLDTGDTTDITLDLRATDYISPSMKDVSPDAMERIATLLNPGELTHNFGDDYFDIFGSVLGRYQGPTSGVVIAVRLVHAPSGTASPWQVTPLEIVRNL